MFHHTRAVAETPLKLKKGLSGSGGFSFWARAGGKDCVDQRNLAEYWKELLMTGVNIMFLRILNSLNLADSTA